MVVHNTGMSNNKNLIEFNSFNHFRLVTQELTFYVQNLKALSIGSELDLHTIDLWKQ